MSRWISLIVLLAVIVVTGVVLYRVMASFLLPLFLSAVLAVIFRPLHTWMETKLKGRPATAAMLTTGLILLTVLLPILGITALAIHEGLGAISGDVLDRAEVRLARMRDHLELDVPFRVMRGPPGEEPLSLADLDRVIEQLPPALPEYEDVGGDFRRQLEDLSEGLGRLDQHIDDVVYLVKAESDHAEETSDMRRVRRMLASEGPEAFEVIHDLKAIADLARRYANEGPEVFPLPSPAARALGPTDSRPPESPDAGKDPRLAPNQPDALRASDSDQMVTVSHLRRLYRRLAPAYATFRIDLLGGPIWAWLTDVVNPSAAQVDSLRSRIQRSLSSLLPSVAGQATAWVGSSLLGMAIIALAVYYFLKDGPSMVETVMKLSPLEDRYERELVTEFETVSRAVVLATLLSALAQGLLGGIAYFFAGFESIFLLAGLTIVFAMIPFVGAAAVWLPACLWLAAVEERYLAAIVLFIYGVTVISMADNFIKPYVLHGQSKLHPLLALLSVLGGVQALGPIGILVGPMVVSFLQALLNILQHELEDLGVSEGLAKGGSFVPESS